MTHSQRASRIAAALPIIATTFIMHAMVRRYSSRFKMPRRDAYIESAGVAQRATHEHSKTGIETDLFQQVRAVSSKNIKCRAIRVSEPDGGSPSQIGRQRQLGRGLLRRKADR